MTRSFVKVCPACKQEAEFRRYCGAWVCVTESCKSAHVGMDRCYCGWARSGGDGYRELIDMGEVIEEDS